MRKGKHQAGQRQAALPLLGRRRRRHLLLLLLLRLLQWVAQLPQLYAGGAPHFCADHVLL